jgi:O-antigen/teichoic acid export membrane protein
MYLSQAFGFVVSFASTVILARLVSPRDFGIFAMAGAVTTVINLFVQFGLAKYIVRETELSREMLRSAFTVNVVMTLVYVVLIVVGAFSSIRLFGSPEVGQFLFVFALFPLAAMMEFIPSAICSREMRFGVVSLMVMLRAAILSGATVLFALYGFAYMSFAWAQVLSSVATAIVYNIIVWRPDVWKPRFIDFSKIVKFGTQMIGISGASQLSTRGGEMALGSLLGLASLGLYTRASNIPNMLYGSVFLAGSNVIFSRLSHEYRTTGQFHGTFVYFLRIALAVIWPLLIGLAILAQPAIHIIYGAKWQDAAWPLSLLTAALAITLSFSVGSEIFVLKKETERQVKIETARAAIGFVLFTAGAAISLTFAAAARVVEALIAFLLYRSPMARLVGAPKGVLASAYSEAFLLTTAAVLPSFLLMLSTGWSPTTPVLPIVGAVVLGVVLWAGIVLIRRHPIALEAIRVIRQRRQSSAGA